jgi:pyridoxal biosynthesis lyase PdxS
MKTAVMALMIDRESESVLLQRRLEAGPWYGKWNMPAGVVCPTENLEEAVSRIFKDETTIVTEKEQWTLRATLLYPDTQVYVFVTHGNIYTAKRGKTHAPVIFKANTNWEREPIVPNLKYLIPLCLATDLATPVILECVQ